MEKTSFKGGSGNIHFELSLNNLREFAEFLLGRIDEVSEEYFEWYTQRNPSLINLIDESGKKEVKEDLIKDLGNFLENIYSGSILEKELIKVESRKYTNLPGFPTVNFHPGEINLRYNLIKKLFYKFLPFYSNDVYHNIVILQEFEEITLFINHRFSSLQIDVNHQNLKRERDFTEALITHSTNGIISFDKNLSVTEWNKIIEKISGIKREYVYGKNIFELYPDYRETEEGKAIQRVLKGEKVSITERTFANGRGYYTAQAVPLFGEESEVIGGFIVFNDITQEKLNFQKIEAGKISVEKLNEELIVQINELKSLQEQLKSNEKLLRKALQLAHLGTWVWEVKENRISWSEELCSIFDISQPSSSVSMKSYLEKVHPEERGLVLRRIREGVRSRNPFSYQHRIMLRDGNIKYIYGEGIPEDIKGNLIITGFFQDITQKMKAIETLQSSENRFRALCEKSPDAIFLVDKKSILYCNQAAVSMLGAQNKSQVLAHTIIDFSSETLKESGHSSRTMVRKKVEGAFEGNSLRFETRLNKFNKERFWSEIIFTPIKLEEQDILHVVIRDISKRKKAESEIIKAQAELKRINNELETRIEERTKDLEDINKNLLRVNADMDNFIYSVSHDLKAPISNIEGLTNELINNSCYQQKEVKILVDMMMMCVHRFTRTINELSDVTKSLRSDNKDVHKIDLEEMVEDIKITIQNLISSSEVKIVCDFSSHKCILFSRRNLHSILYNLISNAIKYHSPERTPYISIATADSKDFIELSVKDNGLGLKESDKKKVFMMFKRAHNHVEGSGVGLYLVKRMIENEGGKIELNSELGKGSEFKLYFKKR